MNRERDILRYDVFMRFGGRLSDKKSPDIFIQNPLESMIWYPPIELEEITSRFSHNSPLKLDVFCQLFIP